MNRMEEYKAMIDDLAQPAPALETTLDRACRKKRKRTARMIGRSAAGVAACFAAFVLLVNYCAPVAHAFARIPVLRELAEAVTFSRSLADAVENEYAQPLALSQTENGITAEIAYLIVDQKQVNVFYRLESDEYETLSAHPKVACADKSLGFTMSYRGVTEGELLSFTVDFIDDDVPDNLNVKLNVYSGSTDGTPDYLAEFEFLLEFDPKFTASGKVFPVDQTVILDGQSITITGIEVYPTHLRVEITESAENTAWLTDLDFYIEIDGGRRFESVSNGISATGSAESPSMVSYRADSTYFYEAEDLKLVITGARWLRKDMGTTYVNLVTGETGTLPEGVTFDSAERQGDGWVVRFRAVWDESQPMYQLFSQNFYDADGNKYEIHQWSSTQGEADANRNITYFCEEIPLNYYSYDEVWLTPQYSHYWTAENLIIITVQ